MTSAGHAAAGINPEVKLAEYHGRIDLDNARELVRGYDVIADVPVAAAGPDCGIELRTVHSCQVAEDRTAEIDADLKRTTDRILDMIKGLSA